MNRILAHKKSIRNEALWGELRMPPWIPESEKRQVQALLPAFVDAVLNAQPIQDEILHLSSLIDLPLKCQWLSPDTSGFPDVDPGFLHIWLISASSAAKADMDSTYVQGGGDDHESWSLGLTPTMFWRHKDEILEYSDDVEAKIRDAVLADSTAAEPHRSSEITWLGSLGVGYAESVPAFTPSIGLIVDCSSRPLPQSDARILSASVAEGKADKNKLSKILPKVLNACRPILPHKQIVIVSTDSATCICVCLAILVEFFDETGVFSGEKHRSTKESIKSSLLFLQSSAGVAAAPPRWMLTDLNRYFLTQAENQPRILQKWRRDEHNASNQ
eukprot:TRINITY_DN913_c0_g1_i4.p1 TRINITY_DN913_c0_g1~~TRINITY_DN913_c0_g1_i4.p1  ORF type:complete len:330 (+),score=41.53 TRINITY_DN913_c0_g1_i4:451-1440(+)